MTGPQPSDAQPPGAPPPGDPAATELLPCGRDALAVVDRARADESTEHEQSCPYCRRLVDEDRAGAAARVALAARERGHAVPPDLLQNVMRSVWSDVRRLRLLPITSPGGPASVAQHVVSAVVEDALADLLQVRSCTLELRTGDTADDTAGDTVPSLAVPVRAAAAYGVDLHQLAGRARAVVVRTVDTQFGWRAQPVDIDVVDLYIPGGTDDGR